MRITTLVENSVFKPKLVAEHGLSLLIETDGEAILFDTGQGYALRHNAEEMGIDLSKVQKIILSHGHYDHTGGLGDALKASGGAHIYSHPDIFDKKCSKDKQNQRFIGIPYTREALELKGANLHLSRDPVQISDNIRTTGEIGRKTDFETISDRLCVMRDGMLKKDELMDDLSLVVTGQEGLAVIFGCGHSGVINTLMHVQQMTDNAPIHIVVGGIHLIDAEEDRINKTVRSLKELNIRKLAPCHCTGTPAMVKLYQAFGNKLIFNNVGTRMEF